MRPSRFTLAFVFAAVGCGTEVPQTEPSVSYRDSLGIQIVENIAPEWRSDAGWKLGGAPVTTIGLVEGEEPYLLAGVIGAVLTGDGNIVIANSVPPELRIFDRTGRHLRTVGRRGRGPGEYVRPAHLLVGPGDSLLVWDAGLSTVSILDPQGTFVRRETLDLTGIMEIIGYDHASEALTPLPDGSFVLHVQRRGDPHTMGMPPGEVFRPPIGFYRFQRDLSDVDSLGWYGGLPQMYQLIDGQPVYATTLVTTHARVAGNGEPLTIFVGNGDPYQFKVLDAQGEVQRIVRRLLPPVAIPDAELERLRARNPYGGDDRFGYLARHRRVRDALPPQTHYPAYRELFADRAGYVWVLAAWEAPSVFRPDGRWLGRIDLPGRPLDIGTDYALLLHTDSLGVQRVSLYDLIGR